MWRRTVRSSELSALVEDKVHEIAQALSAYQFTNVDYGLIGGRTGAVLFDFHYRARYNLELTAESLENLVTNTLDMKGISISHGIAGTLIALDSLREAEIVDLEELFFDQFSNTIERHLQYCIELHNYDYLHGAFGLLQYYSLRSHLLSNESLSFLINSYLNSAAEVHPHIKHKVMIRADQNVAGYSLGLAHGTAGQIITLINYNKLHNSVQLEKVIRSLVSYLYSVLDHGASTFFPNYIVNDKPIFPSRFGWCYGDLGCTLALFYAGNYFEDSKLQNEMVKILKILSKRRGLKENRIEDADFCHGTAGIAHFFARLYNLLGVEEFREAAEHWLEQTLRLGNNADGLAGYVHNYGTEGGLQKVSGLLEGISGIGLTLLSAISDTEPTWDRFFLLNLTENKTRYPHEKNQPTGNRQRL